MPNTDYGEDSLTLKGEIGGIRLRPESQLGSRGVAGAEHTVIEMIGNSLDEKNSGYGDTIDVTWFGDGRIAVRDYGRGIPLGWNEKAQEWNWVIIYQKMYGGGKFDDKADPLEGFTGWGELTYDNYSTKFAELGINYLFSVGLNGIGSVATCATSQDLTVKSYRDGKVSTMTFHEGNPAQDSLNVEPTTDPDGTYIEWRPDPRVFDDANVPEKWLRETVRNFSYASAVTINYTVYKKDGSSETVTYKASDVDHYMADKVKNGYTTEDKSEINPLSVETRKGVYHGTMLDRGRSVHTVMVYEIALGRMQDTSQRNNRFFVNGVAVKGGTPEEGFEDACTGFFLRKGREQGIRFRREDYAGKVNIAVSMLVNKTSYRNQTKDTIDSQYIYDGLINEIAGMLDHAYSVGAEWITKAVQEAFDSYEARKLVEQMSKENTEVKKAISRTVTTDKFRPCRLYNKKGHEDECEMWIVEGNSAGEQVTASRNADYQAVYYLRGKGLNPVKNDPVTALTGGKGKKGNREIGEILNLANTGTSITNDFDLTKSRFGKYIIASDADQDGYHIRMLTFLIFWIYAPEIVYNGMFYIAEPPLWKIDLNNGESEYFITDQDLEKARPRLQQVGIRASHRYKGLGQMNVDELAESTLEPGKRVLRQVKIDRDDVDVDRILNVLFGSDTTVRKDSILSGTLGEDGLRESYEDLSSRLVAISDNGVESEFEVRNVVL